MTAYRTTYYHDYPDDTTLEYTESNGRNQIELTFTSEDPDAGMEIMVYGGEDCMEELMLELYTEISSYLDSKEYRAFGGYAGATPETYYDEYTRTALYAFEAMLMQELRLDD